MPLKLRIIQIARMKLEKIRVHRDGGVLETDQHLDRFPFQLRTETEQRMLIEAELIEYKAQALVW